MPAHQAIRPRTRADLLRLLAEIGSSAATLEGAIDDEGSTQVLILAEREARPIRADLEAAASVLEQIRAVVQGRQIHRCRLN